MADGHEHDHDHEIHLPGPSLTPLVLSLGIALVLGAFVPENIAVRLAVASIGAVLVIGAMYEWLRHALAEYRDLPD
jgi:hypothetical protein